MKGIYLWFKNNIHLIIPILILAYFLRYEIGVMLIIIFTLVFGLFIHLFEFLGIAWW